ncbi:siderophore [Aspergillus tubingensis]|uniref:Siderophore n=1 Tax=Aspergillus tubingensis TaxID=5068 RepID=A0A9W6AIE4_ASPTU|nr:siderophore [Aspergillus tubingensis]
MLLQTVGIGPDTVGKDGSRDSTTWPHNDRQTLRHLSMTGPLLGNSISPNRRRALFETTKRVLASAINDGIACATLESCKSTSLLLCLRSPGGAMASDEDAWIMCGMRADAYTETDGGRVLGFVRADDLLEPVLSRNLNGEISEELDPGVICRVICRWRSRQDEEHAVETLVKELTLSKLHRACLAQSPLDPIMPDDIPYLLEPELSFLCVPKSDMKVFGPFQSLLDPLITSLGIPKPDDTINEIVIPCFSRQLPAITPLFPKARILRAVQNRCRAQLSMRTVSMMPDVGGSRLHLKLSLNCQITSRLRTISPDAAALAPAVGKILQDLLPQDLWIFEEAASVTGAQKDFDKACQLTCIIRKSPEKRAADIGETLIPVAGLLQKPLYDDRTYMEIIFSLDDLKEKQAWFRKYLTKLFSLIFPPMIRHGIYFEAHSQNILVRVNLTSKEISGFALRDFDGIGIHCPTFLRHPNNKNALKEIPPGARTLTDNLPRMWQLVHHALLQVHVGHLLYMLGLESRGGWRIVREELERALNPSGDPDGRALYDYWLKETMLSKCFLEMRLRDAHAKKYEREMPNILLRDA